MRKSYVSYVAVLVTVSLLLASVLAVRLVFAKTQSSAAVNRNIVASADPAVAHLVAEHTMKMSSVPWATAKASRLLDSKSRDDSRESDQGPNYEQLKEGAAHNPQAPVSPSSHYYQRSVTDTSQPCGGCLSQQAQLHTASAYTPSVGTSFQGMADANAICPPVGCQAPDQALAVSPTWVFQGVNTSFAVYSASGVLQPGWPKTAQSFYGVPNPSNGCASVPYLIDPRAFYDPNDGRFWAAILQDENAVGHQKGCPFQADYWIAVSQTSDPNGSWNVYEFDMTNGTTNGADFTELGFDAQAIYFTGNMWNQAGTNFQYAEIFAASKSLMESGASVTPKGFFNLQLNGVPVDSVQPVETEAHSYSGPNVGLFVNSLNYNFGNFECSGGCQGLVVWALANPTSANPSLTSVFVNTTTYTLPPYADEPGCTSCLDTDQTEITGTPIYRDGVISFALNTGVNNGSQVVPAIFWGQVSPALDSTGAITNASIVQSGYFNFQGDVAAFYPALMSDADGNLFMVFDVSSSATNPEVDYVARSATFIPGLFPDSGNTLRAGDTRTVEFRWGDYDAASYDGLATDNVWFAGEYASANGYWSTYIGQAHFITTTATPTPIPTPTPCPTPTTGSSSYRSAVLADQPVIYYRLDETCGTTAADSSGNGSNGTYTAIAKLNQTGATSDGDAAISGNGRTLQYSAGTGLPTGSAPFSVEVWYKTTATPSSPYGSALVAWGTENSNQMFALKIYSSTQLKLANWLYAYYFTVPSGANTLDGNWHYVVVTFDGSHATVYYDGQSLGTQAISLNVILSSAGLVLGSQTGNNDSLYNGFTDEVAIYNKVLSASQVQTHYSSR